MKLKIKMSKNHSFTAQDAKLAAFSKALSHPARLVILRELSERGTCVCGEIVDILPLAQATVSQHLKELKELGLIKGEIEGVKSCYCINWDFFEGMADEFSAYFKSILINKENDQCC